jgi:TonB family protein
MLLVASIHSVATAQLLPVTPDTPLCVEPEVRAPENEVLPKYPMDGLQNNNDTAIVLRVVVSAEGDTKEITGPPQTNEFERVSLDAVGKWRFYPALVEGKAVETVYRVYIHFNSVLREAIPELGIESPQAKAPTPVEEEASESSVYKLGDPGVVQPKAIYSPAPEFTEEAQKKHEVGDVILSLIVGTDGQPYDVRVSCGSVPDLNQQAVETVKLWRFEPGTKDSEPVAVRMEVSTSFRLY